MSNSDIALCVGAIFCPPGFVAAKLSQDRTRDILLRWQLWVSMVIYLMTAGIALVFLPAGIVVHVPAIIFAWVTIWWYRDKS